MKIFKKAEPQTVEVKGHLLRCAICNNTTFYTRQAQLNTSVSTFFNLEGKSIGNMFCMLGMYLYFLVSGKLKIKTAYRQAYDQGIVKNKRPTDRLHNPL